MSSVIVARAPGSDEALLRAYLLEELSEPQRAKVEARLLSDGTFFEAAAAIEGDLLAAYAAGRLDASAARVVRRWLAASPEIRRRLELIRDLGTIAGEARRPTAGDRRRVPALWRRLSGLTAEERRRRVSEDRALGGWELCERVCAESIKAAADNAKKALDLARLAVAIAERTPGPAPWRDRLLGFATAFEANSHRVSGDLARAEMAMARALELWRRGADGDPERLLAEWEIPALEATLRREQRRFAAALEANERALGLAPPGAKGRLLITRALTFEAMGDCESAVATLREAARSLASRSEPRLRYCVDFNLAVNLWHLGRSGEARKLLPRLRQAAERSGNDLDSLRVRWLAARVAAGLGDTEQAVHALEQVQRDLEERQLPYDSALAALDLALLYREQRRWGEIRALAQQMLEVFRAQGIQREALAAVSLLAKAAQDEAVSAEVIRTVQGLLARAQPVLGVQV